MVTRRGLPNYPIERHRTTSHNHTATTTLRLYITCTMTTAREVDFNLQCRKKTFIRKNLSLSQRNYLWLRDNYRVCPLVCLLGNWTFRPLAVSPPRRFAPCLDVSPPGRFAPWTIRPLDDSPPRRFAPYTWTFRPLDVSPLDDSPHTCGRFAPWTFRPKLTVLCISPCRRGRTDGRFAALTHVSVKS